MISKKMSNAELWYLLVISSANVEAMWEINLRTYELTISETVSFEKKDDDDNYDKCKIQEMIYQLREVQLENTPLISISCVSNKKTYEDSIAELKSEVDKAQEYLNKKQEIINNQQEQQHLLKQRKKNLLKSLQELQGKCNSEDLKIKNLELIQKLINERNELQSKVNLYKKMTGDFAGSEFLEVPEDCLDAEIEKKKEQIDDFEQEIKKHQLLENEEKKSKEELETTYCHLVDQYTKWKLEEESIRNMSAKISGITYNIIQSVNTGMKLFERSSMSRGTDDRTNLSDDSY